MTLQKVLQHSFKKNTTLSHSVHQLSESTMKPYRSTHNCVFQRLITAGIRNDQLEDIFPVELCSYPSAIFEATLVTMPANTPALADTIWALIHRYVVGPTGQSQYIVWRVPGAPNTVAARYNLQWHVGNAQCTSLENMDMPLLSSTGIRKDYLQKMVPMNVAQVEEQAQECISHGIWSWSLKRKPIIHHGQEAAIH